VLVSKEPWLATAAQANFCKLSPQIQTLPLKKGSGPRSKWPVGVFINVNLTETTFGSVGAPDSMKLFKCFKLQNYTFKPWYITHREEGGRFFQTWEECRDWAVKTWSTSKAG
jgi:hypothetical protein